MLLLVLAAALACVTCEDAESSADTVLKGTLTGQDNQTWRLVPFDVPAGTTRITVDFDYTTRAAHTSIDVGLLGPDGFRGANGFRGWSGGNKLHFTISTTDATPSYLPGPLQPGTWNLLLGIPNIRPETRAEFTATVRLERNAAGLLRHEAAETVLRAAPGWYRGDLHMHTAHSDGSCLSRRQHRVPCPLFVTAQAAGERGLDFIAITDHNTISQADGIRELQPYFDDLLLIPGREITTFQGHANLFGSLGVLDFRVGSTDVPDWNTLMSGVEHRGGLISINHPKHPSGEQCMGCGWNPPGDVDYARVQAVEVINGLDAGTPVSGIPFWEHLLDQGYRLTALGGSDNHDASSGTIGTPTTVIYADELSQAGIVAAIRRGRVFIDVAGTRHRALDVTASVNGEIVYMGDTLHALRGTQIRFAGTVNDVSGGKIEVIVDGQRAALLRNSDIESGSKSFEFTWRADGRRHWVRIDVRDEASRLALLGNPIYLSGPLDPAGPLP